MDPIIAKLKEKKIIAIVRGLPGEKIIKTAKALREGGIGFIEVTFNQSSPSCLEDTYEAIRSISESIPDICAGAGTVVSVEQAEAAWRAGANYIISPDFNEAVVAKTLELGMLSMPGAFSPTEIAKAYAAGATFVKVFPASNLGPDYIKAVRAPLSHIPLLAVGGISDSNMEQFYKAGAAGFGIGGSLVDKKLIDAGNFEAVTEIAKRYVDIATGL
ncbi:MAG TPA: bifunctional 4-hydroxy-2-oxoglutarate aldolase/2-dehydro-3-deoxy-phosphogluconate aldolase [Anaerovoracaceae bacterium]|nr:bifunctional 4-hydroxy-2-oxoglutarate aldolase/2-dehydro-3-deoxy-phosphogluconate aldolase [Anaerovoracaceae bacterium]